MYLRRHLINRTWGAGGVACLLKNAIQAGRYEGDNGSDEDDSCLSILEMKFREGEEEASAKFLEVRV